MRLTLRLQRVDRKCHVGIFVVHQWTDHATRQVRRLVAEFLPRLIELFGDVGGRRAVTQDHHREGQPRTRKGLGPVIPAELLQPLFEPLGDQLLHLLGRGSRPDGDDGHLLDRERRIFRPTQAKERHQAGDGDCQQQEQCDGALANRERGEIEAAHGHSPPLTAARATASLPVSRTCSPSCSRCAPSETTRSPALSSPTTDAASSPRPATCTARHVTRGVSPSTSHTPGPLPASKIAPIGTCSCGADRPFGMWIEMVEPSGASAGRPSSTYRASNVRVSGCAASDSWRSVAGPPSPFPYKLARPMDPIAARRVSGSWMTASRRPARATRTTTCPAATTCPGSASVSTTTPSASETSTA